jgi:hypothetical protein|tara:strand:- start:65 stop:1345 length:1281 start_codon:yes stop_codon:yes gene_type:complete
MIENSGRIDKIIPEAPENYEGYLYKITVTDTGKKYIGYRSKPYDGTYFYSSECPIFASDLANAKKIVYEILDYGYNIDMATREREMLVEVNAKDNPDYYNKSNGGGIHSIASFSTVEDVYDSILNGDMDNYIQNILVTTLMSYKRIQVRLEDDSKHIKNITDKVNDNWGDSSYIKENYLCHALENYDGKGRHRLINGNHTRKGISKSKVGKTAEVPTMIIPKSIWGKFDETDLEGLGLMLNPREKNFRKPTDDVDLQKQLLSRYFKKKIPVDSIINKTWLKDRFYMTSNQVTGLIKKTKKEMLKQENNLMGKVWIDWGSDDWSDSLESRLDEHKDKNTFTMAMTSGKFDWNKIIARVLQNYPKKKNFILYVHHPSPDNVDYEDNWYMKKLPAHKPELELIFDKLGINWKIEYLPTLTSDGTKEETE